MMEDDILGNHQFFTFSRVCLNRKIIGKGKKIQWKMIFLNLDVMKYLEEKKI